MVTQELLNFNALDWIDRYFAGGVQIDYEELRPILCFSLIWNLFETVACGRNATPDSIRRSVDRTDQAGRLHDEKYLRYLDYFRNRYLRAGTIEQAFDGLLMTNRQSQVVVRRALNDEARDLNNIVYALLLIAHRIRNNLLSLSGRVKTLAFRRRLQQVFSCMIQCAA
ncbi:MAG: hypothetical protein H0U54_16730 [Acidobacteria bacterium]|jgi:hypothetical protein|nr:hypothetical protein [Acidobacteriota bacterium]